MNPDLRAPFPYFGGKRNAAARVWAAFGDPGGYVEPFAGSAAVLLARPPLAGRRVETLNDLDAWLINTWRAIRLAPAEVAEHAAGPNSEIDYHARLAWLHSRRDGDLVSWLEGDPEHHDAKAAGWWLYVMAAGIGDPWGGGPWKVQDGRLVDTRMGSGDAGVRQGIHRALPSLGQAGRGIWRDNASGLEHYMEVLADRLKDVRITCGSWDRVLTPGALRARAGRPEVAVFLDPPYATSGDLYATTNGHTLETLSDLGEQIRQWCLTEGRGYRIVLCGYEDEHDALLEHGWSVETGLPGSGNGMSADPRAGKRERLWLSPECLGGGLFDLSDADLVPAGATRAQLATLADDLGLAESTNDGGFF